MNAPSLAIARNPGAILCATALVLAFPAMAGESPPAATVKPDAMYLYGAEVATAAKSGRDATAGDYSPGPLAFAARDARKDIATPGASEQESSMPGIRWSRGLETRPAGKLREGPRRAQPSRLFLAAMDAGSLDSLREGDMRKLVIHDTPKPTPDIPWVRGDGSGEGGIADHAGQYVLLNFWATWCAPCRVEMPTLSALQSEFGGDAFRVVTVATGPNASGSIERFLDEIGVDNLPRHTDPRQELARAMSVLGLPVTVIVDPEGREIARLTGEADWYSESARGIIGALVADRAAQ